MKVHDIHYQINRCMSERGLNRAGDQPTAHVRLEKVRALREAIETGAYRINYDRIAETMLCLFRNDIPGLAITLH